MTVNRWFINPKINYLSFSTFMQAGFQLLVFFWSGTATVASAGESRSIAEFAPGPGSKIRMDASMFVDIDRHALQAPVSVQNSIEDLAAYLIAPAKNDLEKVRSIYRWITANISYDVEGYRTGDYGDLSPENVLTSGNAVCSGYTGLFGQLADAAGIEVVEIDGWAKGIGYEAGDSIRGPANHAWNAVKIGDGWYLIDSTWGAGSCDGINFIRRFEEHYFLTPPEQFIFDHLPEDPAWQLLETPLSETEFVTLPHVKSHFFRNGLQMDSHFQSVIETDNQISIFLKAPSDVLLSASLMQNGQFLDQTLTFVQRVEDDSYQIDAVFPVRSDYILRIFVKHVSDTDLYRQAIDYKIFANSGQSGLVGFPGVFSAFHQYGVFLYMPKSGQLKIGTTQQFKLIVPHAQKVAVIIGGTWYPLMKNDQFFEGDVKIQKGEIKVCAEFLYEGRYECLLNYRGF